MLITKTKTKTDKRTTKLKNLSPKAQKEYDKFLDKTEENAIKNGILELNFERFADNIFALTGGLDADGKDLEEFDYFKDVLEISSKFMDKKNYNALFNLWRF